MQRRIFIRTAGLTAASILLLGPAAPARTIDLAPSPKIDPAQYGVWDIQNVLMGVAASNPTITYPDAGARTKSDKLPVIRWEVPVSDAAAFVEASRYLMLGHFGTLFAQGGTLTFVYSGAQHEVTLVLPTAAD